MINSMLRSEKGYLEDPSKGNKYLNSLVGQNISNDLKISCSICGESSIEANARGFLVDGDPLEIVICANRFKPTSYSNGSSDTEIRNTVREIITHELVHAYDYKLQICDFSTCEGLAHTEIKAAREAECANVSNLHRFIPWLKNICIREHAVRSTANLYDHSVASKCVDKVFDDAVKDKSPFDR